MKYKKLPVDVRVDAFKLGYDPVPVWFLRAVTDKKISVYDKDGNANILYKKKICSAKILTAAGEILCNKEDYIILKANGEISSCSSDEFLKTYEPLNKWDSIREDPIKYVYNGTVYDSAEDILRDLENREIIYKHTDISYWDDDRHISGTEGYYTCADRTVEDIVKYMNLDIKKL